MLFADHFVPVVAFPSLAESCARSQQAQANRSFSRDTLSAVTCECNVSMSSAVVRDSFSDDKVIDILTCFFTRHSVVHCSCGSYQHSLSDLTVISSRG
jgi:hypothetical protein